MERVLSQDERIRRAEELYARRRMINESRTSATVNVEGTSEGKLTKKTCDTICFMHYYIHMFLCG